MKYLLILALILSVNFAAAQDSIYIKKDTVTQNVIIYDASDDSIIEVFNPDKDLSYGGSNSIIIKFGRWEIYGIKPDEVTKTVLGTTETAFSGTAQDLLSILATSFFY